MNVDITFIKTQAVAIHENFWFITEYLIRISRSAITITGESFRYFSRGIVRKIVNLTLLLPPFIWAFTPEGAFWERTMVVNLTVAVNYMVFSVDHEACGLN